jgi:DNA-binding MarR family transcriptional regulator
MALSIPGLPAGLPANELNELANTVHSVSLRLLRQIRVVDGTSGLSGPRISLLSVLVFAGPLPIGKLATIEQISGPAITKLVDGLAKEGLARRVRSSTDRRVVLVEATKAGRRRLEEGRARRVNAVAAALGQLDPRERVKVRDAFQVLARLLR